ncbi:MAG: hypothetical protein RQ847_05065 [Wenzhouxiangellaceae bacterium]|nr:hypothetical protein [Wenzhouxiangellaceae bacterium]
MSLPSVRSNRCVAWMTSGALLLALAAPTSAQLPALGAGDLIEPVQAESGARNDHPVTLDPTRLYDALASLEIRVEPTGLFRRNREARRSPVFTEDQLEQLVPYLVEALAELKPDRDLGVRVSQTRRSNEMGFLSGAGTTSARVFHRDGELHLIFGQFDKDISLDRDRPGRAVPNAPPSLGLDRGIGLLDAIGSRQHPSRLDWELILPEGARLVDGSRDDWIAVRPAAFEARADSAQPPTTTEAGSPGAGARSPKRPASSPRPRQPNSADAAVPAVPQAGAPEPAVDDPVEQKLRRLKHYRDKGLIDEELYREKVRELIDGALDDDG